jgi:hypothetical protein
MARQSVQVQLEQSDMYLALNMTNVAKEGFSQSTIQQQTQCCINQCNAYVREGGKKGVESSFCRNGQPAINPHPTIVCEHSMERYKDCHENTAITSQKH